MTGPVPVMHPHASQAFDNDLDADRLMDQDELFYLNSPARAK